jgi:hypothetical protein
MHPKKNKPWREGRREGGGRGGYSPGLKKLDRDYSVGGLPSWFAVFRISTFSTVSFEIHYTALASHVQRFFRENAYSLSS